MTDDCNKTVEAGFGAATLLERMSERQRTAILNHCRLAGETVHPRFYERDKYGLTLIVTVNSGYE